MQRRTFWPVLGLVLLTGCPDSKPKGDLPPLHPTRGKVVRGGQDVHGGSLRFVPQPDAPNLMTTAEVQTDGTFEAQTIHTLSQKKGHGLPAGTYKVTYMPPMGDQTQGGGNPTSITPTETFTIKDGPNELTIEVGKK